MNASFTKLKSGDWGLRVMGEKPTPGMVVRVSKKDGTVVSKTVGTIVWSDGNVSLCTCAADAPATESSTTNNRRRGWRPCGYPGCNPSYCDECDGEGGGGRGRY